MILRSTIPTIQVMVAFTNNPFVADSTLTWVDITNDVLLDSSNGGSTIAIRRGRQNELGRVEAGTLSLTLNNSARNYDSENASGAYYPNIKPLKRIQVRATWNAVTYKLFTGYVTAWQPLYPGPRQAVTRVTATDALNAIARTTVSVTSIPPGETTGLAIRTALNLIGWPYTTDYSYDGAGLTTVQYGTYANLNALQYIQTIVETENGLCYVKTNGTIQFQDRQWRIRNTTVQATFGDGGGAELPYEGLSFAYDETLIYNDMQVTRQGGTLQEAIDTTSNTNYGPRTYQKSTYHNSDNEALGLAQWLLLRYKDPALRIPQIMLNGELAPSTVWIHALGRDLSDKITVKLRPPGGGTISKDARIEAVSHSIDLDAWRTTWDLSLAGDDLYWIVQDATRGALDSVYKIAY